MKKKAAYMGAYLIFWLSFFWFFRVVFLLYQQELTTELTWTSIFSSFFHGLRFDLAFTAGIGLLPLLFTGISAYTGPKRWIRKSLNYYTSFIIFLLTLICSTDLELFRIWGFRLDASPLLYLNTPQEMVISVGSSPLWLLIILNVLVNLFFSRAYYHLLHPLTAGFKKEPLTALPFYFSAVALLLALLPVRRSSAYFSSMHFANQSALNVPWNFVHSVFQTTEPGANPYRYLPAPTADSLLNRLYPKNPAPPPSLLQGDRPNIVLIIWESLTAKAVERLGGIKGATPHFNALSREGLLFSRFYASGDRSDKGLVAILSGRPALPTTSLLMEPSKTRVLPHLGRSLKKAGYHTAFYYGGDLSFAHLQTYMDIAGFDQQISSLDFNKEKLNSQWGAHDHVVIRRLLNDIEISAEKESPFFKVFFTLSSHEPFDFPGEPRFKGSGTGAELLSALHYTDSAIGSFMEQAKTKEWYENTLFIILADHGHTYPGRSAVYSKEKFHIPMLWLGGALQTTPSVISKTASQTDLAATLLRQLKLPADDFPWSKDIFSTDSRPFATYFFKEGVGIVSDSSYLSFDHPGRHIIEQQGDADTVSLLYGKAYLQQSFGDYLNY